MASGVVKWYNNSKGFGFITPNDGGENVFMHHNGFSASFTGGVHEGKRLSYEVQQSAKGPMAVNVREWQRWED